MLPPALRTSELLAELAGEGEDTVTLDEVLARFDLRAFGVLVMLATLPVFLPVPFGIGAICGPLIALLGLQMALTLHRPWLPPRLRRRRIRRATFGRFLARMLPWLRRLERVSRPRLEVLLATTTGNVVTGILLVLLGVLLSLPIPLTNYPFGLLIFIYAIALIERDGALLLGVWVIGAGTVIGTLLLSTEAIAAVQGLFG